MIDECLEQLQDEINSDVFRKMKNQILALKEPGIPDRKNRFQMRLLRALRNINKMLGIYAIRDADDFEREPRKGGRIRRAEFRLTRNADEMLAVIMTLTDKSLADIAEQAIAEQYDELARRFK